MDITFRCSVEVEGGVCGAETDEHFHICQTRAATVPSIPRIRNHQGDTTATLTADEIDGRGDSIQPKAPDEDRDRRRVVEWEDCQSFASDDRRFLPAASAGIRRRAQPFGRTRPLDSGRLRDEPR